MIGLLENTLMDLATDNYDSKLPPLERYEHHADKILINKINTNPFLIKIL
jgi:hypothetical protein